MHRITSTLFAVSLLGAASLSAAADIDVMTQNQYLGADLTPVLDAATAPDFSFERFNAALVATLAHIAASRTPERVQALAANIRQRNPDVVGLQEAFRFECLPLGANPPPGQGCDHPALKGAFNDHLAATLDALGGRYVLAGKVTQLELALPNGIPFTTDGVNFALLGLADRDAILVRAGLPHAPVAVPGCRVSDDGCNYRVDPVGPPTLTLPLPAPDGTTIAIERGFVAVDVTVRGQGYRVFNTHLEQRLLAPNQPQTRLLQVLQAGELLQAVLQTLPPDRQVLVVGDFNSDPADPVIVFGDPAAPSFAPTPYQVFVGSGFTDTWLLRAPPGLGYSCCQAEDLANARPVLSERIDLIFSLAPPIRVVDMKLIGATVGDKTRPNGHGGLWPSDHASVAARLFFD